MTAFQMLEVEIRLSIEKLNSNKLKNPFYGKEIYFFNECVEPILERNQLMGYIGAFSGNNKELISIINYAVLPTVSWDRLKNLQWDDNLTQLLKLLGLNKEDENKTRNSIPNTVILPEPIFFKRVFNFIKSDSVKLKQFNMVNFNKFFLDEL